MLAHRSFNCSFARPDYSRRTCSQGHVVPDVVLMEQGTESGDALFTAKVAVSALQIALQHRWVDDLNDMQ